MFEILASVGVSPGNVQTLIGQCGRAISWLTADSRSFRNGINIEKFLDAITVCWLYYRMCYYVADVRAMYYVYTTFLSPSQVVFSHSGRGPTLTGPAHTGPAHTGPARSYKVFMKAEDARSKKKSDMWTAPAAESSSKRES